MTQLDRRIREATWRLNLNLIFEHAVIGVAVAGAAWSLAWLTQRLLWPAAGGFAEQPVLGIPFWASAAAALGVAVAITLAMTLAKRVQPLTAAIALDGAAGLKERVSTGLACRDATDPFVQAARQDAEKTAASISVRSHLPYRRPALLPLSIGSVMLAVGLAAFMPALDLLAADKTPQTIPDAVKTERANVKIAVDSKIEQIRKMAEGNAALEDAIKDLKPLDIPETPGLTPDDIRREAVKKIENVADQLAERKNAEAEDTLKQLRRMMNNLEPNEQRDASNKLARAMAAGDFESAKKALEEMKQELAEAAKGDQEAKEKLAEMQQKLEQVAEKLAEQATKNEQLEKELQNKAGMSAEQAKEMLEQLSKMDPEQLKKEIQDRLADKGLSQEQIQKMAEKIANNQKAQKMAQQMAQKMSEAAQAMAQACENPSSQGQGDQAAQGQASLDAAMDQLSEMEMMDQALNELEAQLGELEELKDDIAQGNCPNGDKPGNGGQGLGGGLGEGYKVGKERRAHAYQARKVDSQLRKGKIIGQQLVDGPQVRGEATAEAREAVIAAQRDATDAISRDEIPRQYDRVVRTYFDRLAGLAGGARKQASQSTEPAQSGGDDDDE